MTLIHQSNPHCSRTLSFSEICTVGQFVLRCRVGLGKPGGGRLLVHWTLWTSNCASAWPTPRLQLPELSVLQLVQRMSAVWQWRTIITSLAVGCKVSRLACVCVCVCVCVCARACVSVCLSTVIFQTPHVDTLCKFMCILPCGRGSINFHDNAICYVFSVLWMTSLFRRMGPMQQNQRRRFV